MVTHSSIGLKLSNKKNTHYSAHTISNIIAKVDAFYCKNSQKKLKSQFQAKRHLENAPEIVYNSIML